jgi:hypothetical protein
MPSVSPMRVIKAQSRLKKRLFLGVIAGTALTVLSDYFSTELIFHYAPTELNKTIVESCHELKRGVYKPTWYLPTAFIMSVYGAKIDPSPYMPFERERVPLSDGAVYLGIDLTSL